MIGVVCVVVCGYMFSVCRLFMVVWVRVRLCLL